MVRHSLDFLPPSAETYEFPDSEFPDSDFLSITHEPRILSKKGSERQISVDPISLIESSYPPPLPVTTKKPNKLTQPPPLPLPSMSKSKLLSFSLPSSASSSPRFSPAMVKKKSKSRGAIDPLTRQHSVALTRLAQLQENHLQRSKSCGEGRATTPSDEFELCLSNANGGVEPGNKPISSFRDQEPKIISNFSSELNMTGPRKSTYDEKFKCGACLFLPAFGKGKPVRSPRKEAVEKEMPHVISRTVSLEKFECGSWSSSAIIMDGDMDGDTNSHFFDLPLELIRVGVNDADSPVAAAFVFDKDVKGVLKPSNSRSRRSQGDSSRHVRFSTSSPTSQPTSPTCVTPRLRKAREDFNAFLEAQSV